jgi:hypothetical protein
VSNCREYQTRQRTYLSCNICNRCGGHLGHAVNACIAGASGFGLLLDRTWQCEYVLISLWCQSGLRHGDFNQMSHRDKKGAPEEPVPWILTIILVSMVKEYRPLVTGDGQFRVAQLLLYPEMGLIK